MAILWEIMKILIGWLLPFETIIKWASYPGDI